MEKYIIGEKFDKKFDFRATCFGICEKDNKILLTFKANKNEYALPGGGIEKGEDFEACLRRDGVNVVMLKIFCNFRIKRKRLKSIWQNKAKKNNYALLLFI